MSSFKFMFKAEMNFDSYGKILEKRGLESGGRVQQIIDSEVLRRCDPYVPKDTGQLIDSGIIATDIGSGEVKYETPYAAAQYYNKNYHHQDKRTHHFFEVVKAAQKDDILKTAAEAAGGKAD